MKDVNDLTCHEKKLKTWRKNTELCWHILSSHEIGILTGWRIGLTVTSGSATSRNAMSCTWGGTTPHNSMYCVPFSWKAAWQNRIWGSWWKPG